MTLVERLNLENQILERDGMSQYLIKYYPQGAFYYIYGNYISNSRRSYTIWCQLPGNYPDKCPSVYVHKPNPLIGYDHKQVNSYGVSHDMHTLEPSSNGEVQICHWRQSRWDSSITLNRVMIKVMLWFEAFEQHLSSGKTINDFVRTMQEL